ncbi:TnsA endonuclease N-terminal domain-containing protein [Lysobacter sp. yr284]|uniref:TnsA endonuclease N-terminal domain-containing protein n=1 Tax=Lysobacter sp. yr284 TaxID=1761791 RepID=UPI0015874F7E|nr:TnsA endonuclease N-terminal domain-containing protein [Lysobacter sp. yr284]
MVLLAFDDTVERIEDHAIKIEYKERGRLRTYTPDLFVTFKAARHRLALLIEVKMADELRRTGRTYATRFRAARAYCRSHGMQFRVITERSLPRPMVRNLRFLLPYRREEPQPALDADFLTAASQGPKSLKWYMETLTAKGYGASEVVFAAWRLSARQQLRLDLHSLLSMDTTMEAAPWTVTI